MWLSVYEELVYDKRHYFLCNDNIHIFQDSKVSLRSAQAYFFFLIGYFLFFLFLLLHVKATDYLSPCVHSYLSPLPTDAYT